MRRRLRSKIRNKKASRTEGVGVGGEHALATSAAPEGPVLAGAVLQTLMQMGVDDVDTLELARRMSTMPARELNSLKEKAMATRNHVPSSPTARLRDDGSLAPGRHHDAQASDAMSDDECAPPTPPACD